jgi:AraC-like DNA-binding protein
MMSSSGHLPRAEIPAALVRPVECRAFDIAAGETFRPHAHDWAQFTYSADGVLTVGTDEGRFTAPPAMAVWIPPNVTHEIRTVGAAKFRSLYIASDRAVGMPERCAVLSVDPLLRQLVLEAVALPREWDEEGPPGRLMAVVLDRIRAAERARLDLPLPLDGRLRRVTDALLRDPADRRDLDAFARDVGASSRTLARLFKTETGMTFGEWRQRRVLVAALERLADGSPVTGVALDLGYESPSAFIAMFKRVLGETPSRYVRK